MRKIQRRELSTKSIELLRQRTACVLAAVDRPAEARRLWAQRNSKAFSELREALESMASGLKRCMYCEDSRGSDIDHFYPLSKYPDLAFTWENHLLACSYCNSNQKRDRFPLDDDGQPLLIDPTHPKDDPLKHIRFAPESGKLLDRTRKGEASIEVFGLNRSELESGRKDCWKTLLILIPLYAEHRHTGNEVTAAELRDVMCNQPFSSVLCHLLTVARDQGAPAMLPAACRSALARCPEIAGWVT